MHCQIASQTHAPPPPDPCCPHTHLARGALLAVGSVHAGVQGGGVERLPPLPRVLRCSKGGQQGQAGRGQGSGR